MVYPPLPPAPSARWRAAWQRFDQITSETAPYRFSLPILTAFLATGKDDAIGGRFNKPPNHVCTHPAGQSCRAAIFDLLFIRSHGCIFLVTHLFFHFFIIASGRLSPCIAPLWVLTPLFASAKGARASVARNEFIPNLFTRCLAR